MYDDDEEEEIGFRRDGAISWGGHIGEAYQQYDMSFGFMNGELTGVIFVTTLTVDGVDAPDHPVAFIPVEAMEMVISQLGDQE